MLILSRKNQKIKVFSEPEYFIVYILFISFISYLSLLESSHQTNQPSSKNIPPIPHSQDALLYSNNSIFNIPIIAGVFNFIVSNNSLIILIGFLTLYMLILIVLDRLPLLFESYISLYKKTVDWFKYEVFDNV
jgi:hypothetical protein